MIFFLRRLIFWYLFGSIIHKFPASTEHIEKEEYLMISELLIVAMRIFTIIPLLLAATIYMGRRSIGELPVFDFLIILTLGAVVGADIADPKIEHIHTAVAVVLIAILQKIVILLKIKSRKFGRLITFEPVVVIYDGEFIKQNFKKSNIPLRIFYRCSGKKKYFTWKK
jgi:uncharacterized membrane protein YcaP (DUF421 family)